MFDLPPLPYPEDALEPWISAKTLRFHHGKLHAGYVQRLNQLTRGTHLAQVPLKELIELLDIEDPDHREIWRNAAQAWNHAFLWQSMRPNGGGRPRGILRQVMADEGAFRDMFQATAKEVFGSGWVWLIATPNGDVQFWAGSAADNPMRYNCLPLLTCDCWEHAYYLDRPANREEYIDVFLDHVINWDFAEANYGRVFG